MTSGSASTDRARAEGVRQARDYLASKFHMNRMHLDALDELAAQLDREAMRRDRLLSDFRERRRPTAEQAAKLATWLDENRGTRNER